MTNHPLSTDVLRELARLGGTIPDDFAPRANVVVPTLTGRHRLPPSIQALLAVRWPAGRVLLYKEKVGFVGKPVLTWELRLPAPMPPTPVFTAYPGDPTWFTIGHDWRGHLLMVDLTGAGANDDPWIARFDTNGHCRNWRRLSGLLSRTSAQRPPAKKNVLPHAAARGDVETARALIASGVSPGPVNAAGVTPLHMAALTSRSAEMVRVLVEAGADVNAAITASKAPTLYTIADSGRLCDRELGPGETPLGAALQGLGSRGLGQPVTVEVVTELLRAGADPNVTDGFGRTPLHRACYEGETEAVTALLEAGADPDASMDGGLFAIGPHIRTPGDIARRLERADLVALLGELSHSAPSLPS